ncbi:hypothetical protein H5398_10420 [Tessaracoccus sp. MC1679]|uniref:hypothetical protein n=1 Tax=Tessaracoccus sp. MC1679 TaxID=2760313 RepID=UPI0016019C11|nr:hypothetical protein [Tessaracoccus sp. MC1679]MBB1516379.1 hypothetical protein [Tessaracoccus sp. MC1679]
MSDPVTNPDDTPVVDDSELTRRQTDGPDGGEHLHSSDHSIAEEDIEADRRHQQSTPTQH